MESLNHNKFKHCGAHIQRISDYKQFNVHSEK